jgi:hypothetical protein
VVVQLLRNKYLWGKSITQVNKKPGDPQFWRCLINAKDQFLSFGNFRLQNGKQIRFWEDMIETKCFKRTIPQLI